MNSTWPTLQANKLVSNSDSINHCMVTKTRNMWYYHLFFITTFWSVGNPRIINVKKELHTSFQLRQSSPNGNSTQRINTKTINTIKFINIKQQISNSINMTIWIKIHCVKIHSVSAADYMYWIIYKSHRGKLYKGSKVLQAADATCGKVHRVGLGFGRVVCPSGGPCNEDRVWRWFSGACQDRQTMV